MTVRRSTIRTRRNSETISGIFSANPRMALLVSQDLVRGVANPHTGARGMNGDQVLRVLIVKQMTGFSYEELTFHLADSVTYRSFCGFGSLEPTPGRSALAENVKKLRSKWLPKINRRSDPANPCPRLPAQIAVSVIDRPPRSGEPVAGGGASLSLR